MMLKISAIAGNTQWLDGGAMFGHVPRVLWEKWYTPDQFGRIQLACRALLVESPNEKILLETGIGAYMEPKIAQRYGVGESQHCLLNNLAEVGISDHDIDYVILSHLHFDHAGGLLPAYGSQQADDLLFPNAQYVVSDVAFDRCEKPHVRDRASFIPGLAQKLIDSGRLVRIPVNGTRAKDLPSYLDFYFSFGHTPGQMHTVVKGSKKTIVFAGDLIPGVAWVHLPIAMGYDRCAEMVIDEKKSFYERAIEQKQTFFFTHDPHVALADITLNEQGKYEACTTVQASELVKVEI